MRPFFIFSLPRSGSAWLATFLTYGESFCYHEPCAERIPLAVLFDRPGIIGAVDTLAYTMPRIARDYRCFVLRRSYSEIIASSVTCGIEYEIPREFEQVTAEMPVIDHQRLGDLHYLAYVWDAIVGTEMDHERARQLIRMNIQRDLGKFNALAPHLALSWGG
jgi:hypothetical protein